MRRNVRRGQDGIVSSSHFMQASRWGAVLPGVLALSVLLCACSKSTSSSVLGDATHPTPVRFYTVAKETAQRRGQAVGSLFALEESTLSSQVEGRVAEVLADV